jgi:hypothetical protein
VLLALVGEQWLTITDEDGRRRLDDPDDFVRVEIEAALTRNVRVIPILVDGARMPRADKLPPSLAGLVRRQALELSPARFEYDTSRLLTVLDRTFAEVRTAHEDAAAASASAEKATDLRTTELPKAPEPALGGKKAAEQRARDQAERAAPHPRLAAAGPSLQADPGGEQLSTATGAAEADVGTGVPAGTVEGVHGAEADHVGPGSASGGPRPAARRRRWAWGIAALVAVIAAALVVVPQISGPECSQTASGTATFPASFETGTEGWHPSEGPDAGCTSQASDFATDGSFSLRIDSASTEGDWYGTNFDEPVDISGTSEVSADIRTLEAETQTAIAVQFGDDGTWCETPDWGGAGAGTDLVTVTLDLDSMNCDGPSDLTDLRAVWVWFNGEGSFWLDNVRVE